MENTPVNANFGEAPAKEPNSKEKRKAKKSKTSFSKKLGVEAIFSNSLAKDIEEKPSRNPLRRAKPKAENAPQPAKPAAEATVVEESTQVETKPTAEKITAKAPLETEPKHNEEAELKTNEDNDTEPVLEAEQIESGSPTSDETKTELKDAEKPAETNEPNKLASVEEESDIPALPSADEAWDSINPTKLTVENSQVSTADKPEELERPTKRTTKKSSEAAQEYSDRDIDVVEAETTPEFGDSIVADGDIHEMPEIESVTHQHLKTESEPFIIEHESESADFDYEIQEYTEEDLQFTPAVDEQTSSSQTIETEYAHAGGSGNEPPLPPESFEQPAEEPEPERAASTTESGQTQSFYQERIGGRTRAVPIEAILASEEAVPATAASEPLVVEKRQRTSQRSWSDNMLEWASQKRLKREVQRSHRQQKKQIKEFARQEKKSDEKLSRQLVEQKALSNSHQSKLSKQIEKVTSLISRPSREADVPKPRIRYHVVERERDLIRERQKARMQKQIRQAEQVTRQAPIPAERPASPWAAADLLPKLEEAQYLDEAKTTVEEPVSAPNLTRILETAGYSEPSRAAIERQFNGQTWLKIVDALKPIVRSERAAELKKDEILEPVKSAVAETAIERVLHIPPEHRLLKSAWHSIEVDKTGRAVENPVFAYGHEFMQEQRQEAHSYKAPLTAMQTGLLAIRDASNAVSLSFSPPPVLQASTVPLMPAISIEETVREPKQARGLPMELEENIGLLIAVAIVLLSIAGLLLAR